MPATRRGRWAFALCSAAAAGCGAGATTGAGPVLAVAAAAVVAIAVIAWLPVAGRRRWLMVLVLVAACAGFLRGATTVDAGGPDTVGGHLSAGAVAVLGTVRSASPGGGSVIVDATHISGSDVDVAVHGGLLVTGTTLPPVAPGDSVEVDAGDLRRPDTRPGAESEATLEREGVEAVAVAPLMTVDATGGPSLPRFIAAAQGRLIAAVNQVLPQPAAALVLGIAFGVRESLAADVRTPLQDAGLVHIVVVSGLKIVLLLGMVAAFGRLRAWSRRCTSIVGLVLGTAYVLLSGAGPAAIRSLCMAAVAMVAAGDGRRVDPLPLLALVAAVMLLADPPLALDPGFQLSFLGTAGIVALARPLAARLPGPRLVAEPFAVTVAAQLATVPVMAGTFGVVSLVGPLANALVLPLLPVMIVVCGAGGLLAMVHPALGWLLLQLCAVPANLTVLLARALTSLPGSFIQLSSWPGAWTVAELCGIAAAGAVLLARRTSSAAPTPHSIVVGARPERAASGRRHIAIAAAAGIAATAVAGIAATRPDGRLHVVVMSTGAATAVDILTPDGAQALVDGAGSPALLQQALGRVLPPFTHRIDVVVTTGGEQAAVAGLRDLTASYQLGMIAPAPDPTPGATTIIQGLRGTGTGVVMTAGRAWTWSGLTWQCLPYESIATGSSECVLRVSDGTSSLLVLGDAGSGDQDALCGMYGTALRADVVVAPPGGAISTVLLAVARPALVVAPVAQGGYAAPAPDGVQLLRTSSAGDVTLSEGSGGLAEGG